MYKIAQTGKARLKFPNSTVEDFRFQHRSDVKPYRAGISDQSLAVHSFKLITSETINCLVSVLSFSVGISEGDDVELEVRRQTTPKALKRSQISLH